MVTAEPMKHMRERNTRITAATTWLGGLWQCRPRRRSIRQGRVGRADVWQVGLWLVLLPTVLACSSTGDRADGGPKDAAARDATDMDAGIRDGGGSDAGVSDGGPSDGHAGDAEPSDGALLDLCDGSGITYRITFPREAALQGCALLARSGLADDGQIGVRMRTPCLPGAVSATGTIATETAINFGTDDFPFEHEGPLIEDEIRVVRLVGSAPPTCAPGIEPQCHYVNQDRPSCEFTVLRGGTVGDEVELALTAPCVLANASSPEDRRVPTVEALRVRGPLAPYYDWDAGITCTPDGG